MSVLCYGNCHVYLTGQARCTCGQAANTRGQPGAGGYTPTSAMIFQGYNPFSHHAPAKPAAPDVPLHVFKAARDAGASHLSADGQRIYCQRYGETLEAEWKQRTRAFGAWSVVAEMPGDAVAL